MVGEPGSGMTAASSVRGGSRKGAWLRWAIAFSLALHFGLLVWMYYAKGPEPIARQVERLFPVFIVPRPKPAPPPPPPPPQDTIPRKKEPGGRSGQGMQQPAVPVRVPEQLVEPEQTIDVPPVRNPDPQAPSLTSSAGQGDRPGDGRGAAPGNGPGVGTGEGPGRGAGTRPGWSPQWRRLPNDTETGRYYPKPARAAGITRGRVVMRCTVGVTGRVFRCAALRESPPGYGFGQAAVGMSQYMRINPKRVNGKAVEAELLVPLNITLDGTTVGGS